MIKELNFWSLYCLGCFCSLMNLTHISKCIHIYTIFLWSNIYTFFFSLQETCADWFSFILFMVCCCIPRTVSAQVLFICKIEINTLYTHTQYEQWQYKRTLKATALKTRHHTYHYRWSHTICNKNGLLSNRMSKFVVYQKTATENHISHLIFIGIILPLNPIRCIHVFSAQPELSLWCTHF